MHNDPLFWNIAIPMKQESLVNTMKTLHTSLVNNDENKQYWTETHRGSREA